MERVFCNEIIAVGDSLTAGVTTTQESYPYILGGMFPQRVRVANFGIGGQTMEQIAARVGANPVTVTLTGNAFNGVNSIALTPSVNFLSTSADTTNRYASGKIEGVPCFILCNGTTDSYSVVPSGLESTVAVPAGSLFVPDALYNSVDSIQILWFGRNNLPTLTGLDAIYDRAIANMNTPARYIILGVLNSQGETGSNANYLACVAMNNTLRTKYGSHYVEVTPPTTEEMTAINYTPTTQDNTDIAAGTIPTGMRADSLHLNALGNKLIAYRVFNAGRALGYW